MEAYGVPPSEEYGVISCQVSALAVYATLARRTHITVGQLDAATKAPTAMPVEKVTLIPIGIRPHHKILEVYAGGYNRVQDAAAFLSACLALPIVVDPIETNIESMLEKLAQMYMDGEIKALQLKSVRCSDYSSNSYMIGPYTPKFLDSEHGKDFVHEHSEALTGATVRFAGSKKKVTVKLSSQASFGYSCDEDDQGQIQKILRQLLH
jgi:hypothetical protein